MTIEQRARQEIASGAGDQPSIRTVAIVAAAVMGAIAGLQIALAAGAPWGNLAWGGAEQGQLSEKLRVASGVSAIVLAWMGLVLLTRGAVIRRPRVVPSRHLGVETWAIGGLMALNTAGNLASGNPVEQFVFAPATALLTALAVYLALRGVEGRPHRAAAGPETRDPRS